MNPDGFTVSTVIGVTPDIPLPFMGYFESWSMEDGEEVWIVLNVFVVTASGKQAFLRSFHGPEQGDAVGEFTDWLLGEYNTQLFG